MCVCARARACDRGGEGGSAQNGHKRERRNHQEHNLIFGGSARKGRCGEGGRPGREREAAGAEPQERS